MQWSLAHKLYCWCMTGNRGYTSINVLYIIGCIIHGLDTWLLPVTGYCTEVFLLYIIYYYFPYKALFSTYREKDLMGYLVRVCIQYSCNLYW